MKFVQPTMAIVMAGFLFTACGNNKKEKTDAEIKQEILTTDPAPETKDKGVPTKLNGAWEIKRAEGSMAETNVGTVYEFDGNELSFGKDGYKNPGSTVVTDSTFSFQAKGNELVFNYNYKFNGDTLVVEMQNSGGQIFHMVKK